MEFMNKHTKSALDFQYILNKIHTLTPYGIIHKKKMKAFIRGEEEKLKHELNLVESHMAIGKNTEILRAFNNILSHMKDIRESIKRASEEFALTEVELFEIKNFLMLIRKLENLIDKHNIKSFEETKIFPIMELEQLLDPEETGLSTFYIYDCYSDKLKEIRKDKRKIDKRLRLNKKDLKEKLEKELNINIKLDNSIMVPKRDIELIEKLETNDNLSYVSETYMNIQYILKPTEEISLLESQLMNLKLQEEKEELRIREELSKEIGDKEKLISTNILNIGKLDLLLGKVKYALEINGVKPQIVEEHFIHLENGRHPQTEEFLRKKDLEYMPISMELKEGVTCITGANMGGKSVSLRLIGLLSAMAQYGLFVPAKSLTLGLNNYIITSMGDKESIDHGLSTFGGEIKIVGEAIEKSKNRGLILIDELARGTNPEEGYAISKAIAGYLLDKKAITLLTTHYDNVANLEGINHLQVVGLSKMDFTPFIKEIEKSRTLDIINKYMDYTLEPVKKDTQVPKDAINIARLMGLEEEILTKAEEILGTN